MTGYFGLTARLFLALGFLGLPVRVSAQIAVEFYHLDAIGNVLAVTDNAGAVVEQHDYDVFGQEVNAQAGTQPKRFTGKERDQETGWDYFGARYYGSRLGRFTTGDPVNGWQQNLVDPQEWNRYTYARSNPFRYVDPDGRRIVFADNVSTNFKLAFEKAKVYLKMSNAASELEDLEDRLEIVTLVETASLNPADIKYDANAKSIHWNPGAGVLTDRGGVQSPALGLIHESAHALEHLRNAKRYKDAQDTRDDEFETAEERRVILGPEREAAKRLREPLRESHGGTLISVGAVTETRPE